MRKGWKIFWIGIGGMTVLGVVLLIVAFVLGLTTDTLREGFGGSFVISNLGWHFDQSPSDTYEYSYSAPDDSTLPYGSEHADDHTRETSYSGIRKIEVDALAAVVEFLPAEGEEIIVRGYGNLRKGDLKTYVEGDTLYIESRAEKRGQWIEWIDDEPKIQVLIPAGAEFQEMDLHVGAGRLVAETLRTDYLELSVDAGDITISEFYARTLDMECGAGSIRAAGTLSGDADLTCDVGRLHLELQGAEKDYNIDLKNRVGSVRIGDTRYDGIDIEKDIDNDASKTIEAEVSVGEIQIDFN